MKSNPEFQRNLWLEFTPYRLIGMPAVLCAVFLLVYLLNAEKSTKAISGASLTLFGVIVLLWGTRLASEAVVSEIRDHTWDSQRMSDIGPWAMTWGKLLGSTIYPWYGGVLCLFVYAVVTIHDPVENTARTVALSASAGLFGNAVALLASMQAIKKDRKYNRSMAASFLILGLLAAGPLFSLSSIPAEKLEWFGVPFSIKNVLLLSVFIFLSWTVIGIYRLMRTELQMRNGPFVWLGFSVFLAVYFAGFVQTNGHLQGRLLLGFGLLIGLTYLMAFSERKDPVEFRRLLVLYKERDWARVLQETPSWIITLLPLLVSGLALMFADLPDNYPEMTSLRMSVIAAFLFLIRDLGLFLFFNFAPNARRADWLMVLSLGLFYGVIPGIMNAVNLEPATVLFWPRWDTQSNLMILGPGLEAGLVILLLMKRWKTWYGGI